MKTGKAIAFLLSVIFAIPASAQHKWHIGIGEEMTIAVEKRKEKAWKDDFTLAANSQARVGYVVNGMFIGTAPLGIDPEKISDKWWNYKQLTAEREALADTVIFGHKVRLGAVYEAQTEKPVEWLSLDEARARYVPKMTEGRKCVYMIDKFFIPGNDSLFRIDSDYIQRVEVLQSTCIDALRDLPPFAFVRIFTRNFSKSLAYQPNYPEPLYGSGNITETYGCGVFHSSISNRRMKYYTSLDQPKAKELYQEEALEEFTRLCDSMERRVTDFLTKKERKRWKATGEMRPRLELDISHEGEVLEATVISPVPVMSILTPYRFRELDRMLRSIRFPAFNRHHSPWRWKYRYVSVDFPIME